MPLTVKFDKKTRKALKVSQGDCQFCPDKGVRVAKVFPDMHFCAPCIAEIVMDGAIGRAEADHLSGTIILRLSEAELREAL